MDWNELYKVRKINSLLVLHDTKERDLKKHYESCIENNRCIYKALTADVYTSIDQCVDYALKTGNHAAFIKYLTTYCKAHHELFRMCESFSVNNNLL